MRVYWWSPRRSVRDLRWAARTGVRAVAGMRRYGGKSANNFGDELSSAVVAYAFDRPVKWSRIETADLIAIGSILETKWTRSSQCVVWGSGLRSGKKPSEGNLDAGDFLAVRGPSTRDALGLRDDLTLGDPGLLVSRLFKRNNVRRGRVMIPHFSEFADPEGERRIASYADAGFRVVPPSLPVAEVCHAIGSADFVLTSSLHGLIVSHALAVPVARYRSPAAEESEFKYVDYWGSLGLAEEVIGIDQFCERNEEVLDKSMSRVAMLEERSEAIAEGLLDAARAVQD